MSYSADHASALADVRDAGAAVSFVGVATVAGYAVRDKGKREFKGSETVVTESPRLFFVPSTYGDLPEQNASVSWGGITYTVASVEPIAPDGTALACYVEVGR